MDTGYCLMSVISSFGSRLIQCLLSRLSHGNYLCGGKKHDFPLQKVISHTSLILALMSHSMQFSRITDLSNNQPAAWIGRKSQLGPGRNPSLCASLSTCQLGMKSNQLPSTLGFYYTALSLCSFAKYEFKSRCSNIGNCCENEMT